MIPPRIKLIVIFSNLHERNLPVLRKLYQPRFHDMVFLMPDYEGCDADVIRVGGTNGSLYYQSFIGQAYGQIYDPSVTHYVFLTDDLMLHPALNEHNILGALHVGPRSGYIKGLVPFPEVYFPWEHLIPAMDVFRDTYPKFAHRLPAPEAAFGLMSRHCVMSDRLRRRHSSIHFESDSLFEQYEYLTYPLVMSYADFHIVP